MLASPTAKDQHDRDRVVAALHTLDAPYRGRRHAAGKLRAALGRWRIVTDTVAASVGIGAGHPEAVRLRGRWVVVTSAPWAAGLPETIDETRLRAYATRGHRDQRARAR
jgi:hypothetical protein